MGLRQPHFEPPAVFRDATMIAVISFASLLHVDFVQFPPLKAVADPKFANPVSKATDNFHQKIKPKGLGSNSKID